jgi:uncharacterized membrane protein
LGRYFSTQKITSLKAGEKAQVLAVVKASKKAIPGDMCEMEAVHGGKLCCGI